MLDLGPPGSAARKGLDVMSRALDDVAFHRSLSKRPGNEKPMSRLQVALVQAIEQLMEDGTGDTMTIRVARQWGKNECAAQVHVRHLEKRVGRGGCIVRAAPSARPQLVNSKRRIEKIARNDPLFDWNAFRRREGYIFEYGYDDQVPSEIYFLSADESANVEGATADRLLDMDEAHKTDRYVFQERFEPMTASTNAPRVLWGVAGSKDDLLFEEMQKNLEMGKSHRVINIPARYIAETNEIYRQHYEGRIARLGPTHPVILTQYDLVDVDPESGAFNANHRHSLFGSDHMREERPRRRKAGQYYVVVIDVAGEEEEKSDLEDEAERKESPDSTSVMVARIDTRKTYMQKPMVEILDMHRWVGFKMVPVPGESGGMTLQEKLIQILMRWQPRVTLIDSRGIGQPLASWLSRIWKGRVEKYAASLPSTTQDLYETWAMLNIGQLKCFRDDGSEVYRDLVKELGWAVAKHTLDKVNLAKPKGADHKIDLAKCLTYLPRAAALVTRGRTWAFNVSL